MGHSGINGLSFSTSISVVVVAMTTWFALLNRRGFNLSFSVLFIIIHCTGSVQYPVKVAQHFHRTLYKYPLRWLKNVPQS